MKLTPALISQLTSQPLPHLTELNVSGKQISHIEDISACVNLHKLNLSKNDIKNNEALSGLQYCTSITLLNLSENKLESAQGIDKLKGLFVLNLSHNELNRISIHITYMKELKALILNHNHIKIVENVGGLLNLNTLVISHNKIENLPSLPTLVNLKKLSVAHNELRVISDLSKNTELRELRLNDNKILRIPETIRSCSSLEILDLGNNLLREWSDIAPLGSMLHLINLNLRGNPICQKEDYKDKILALIPSLRVLDGERFDQKFLTRKEKQKEFNSLLKKIEEQKKSREAWKEKKKLRREKKEKKESGDQNVNEEESSRLRKSNIEQKKIKVIKNHRNDEIVPNKKRKIHPVDEKNNEMRKERLGSQQTANKKEVKDVVPEVKNLNDPSQIDADAKPGLSTGTVRSGVVDIIDNTKKMKRPIKPVSEVMDWKKEVRVISGTAVDDIGTGLDVDKWE